MENGPVPKRRRIPKACAACREKKLACGDRRPCTRCTKAGIECIYLERPKDPNLARIERIEGELDRLNERLDSAFVYSDVHTSPETNASSGRNRDHELALPRPQGIAGKAHPSAVQVHAPSALVGFKIRQSSSIDAVSAGYVLEGNARLWFATFFEGCDRFVPVFDPDRDTFDSVRARNNALFDVIVIFGARVTHGALSRPHQRLYSLLREHTSDLVLRLSDRANDYTTIEDIQALLVIASYSDSGGILCDIAIKAAIAVGLPSKLDTLFSLIANHTLQSSPIDRSLFQATRLWYGLFNLDMILSIDGGKPTSISTQASPRRVRSLLHHPQRTALDIRLLAQVELNALRAAAHATLAKDAGDATLELGENDVVKGTILDLDLWLSEWQSIVLSDARLSLEHGILSLNLRTQHAWAILTLHLRALTSSGIDNIALMTDSQRHIASSAKRAAERHLQLLLSNASSETHSNGVQSPVPYRPYVANFKYAMEFVWAKNAFCVLIVLRLGILLGDSANDLMQRLIEAKEFLRELEAIGMGSNVSYTRILAQTVQKCEKAIHSSLQSESERSSAEPGDFQTFIPKEFMFDWDFPGLDLCYVPLDWQDLFLEFGAPA